MSAIERVRDALIEDFLPLLPGSRKPLTADVVLRLLLYIAWLAFLMRLLTVRL